MMEQSFEGLMADLVTAGLVKQARPGQDYALVRDARGGLTVNRWAIPELPQPRDVPSFILAQRQRLRAHVRKAQLQTEKPQAKEPKEPRERPNQSLDLVITAVAQALAAADPRKDESAFAAALRPLARTNTGRVRTVPALRLAASRHLGLSPITLTPLPTRPSPWARFRRLFWD